MSASIFYGYIKKVWPDSEIIWRVHEGKQHGINLNFIPDSVTLAVFPDSASNNFKETKGERLLSGNSAQRLSS